MSCTTVATRIKTNRPKNTTLRWFFTVAQNDIDCSFIYDSCVTSVAEYIVSGLEAQHQYNSVELQRASSDGYLILRGRPVKSAKFKLCVLFVIVVVSIVIIFILMTYSKVYLLSCVY
jgi:hypothetical protein